MTGYRLSPRAQTDIDEIWDYTAEHWGVDQAESYIRTIATAVAIVAADPRRGRTCDEVRRGYRKYPVGSDIIFYHTRRSGIDVVRILHQAMDPGRHL